MFGVTTGHHEVGILSLAELALQSSHMHAGKGCTPCHPEVWVLVNGAGNEALDVPPLPKHVGKCGGEGRRRLHCWERHLPNVGLPLEAKDASG